MLPNASRRLGAVRYTAPGLIQGRLEAGHI